MELMILVKWLLLGVILWIQIHGYKCCFVEERSALLQFKESLGSDVSISNHLLPSWVDDPKNDCCEWERVTCNSTTSHVIQLSLSNIRQYVIEELYDKDFLFLNISSFQHFKELRILDLSFNFLNGSFDNEGFERLSSLKNLEVLHLSYNWFNSSMLSLVSSLTSLKTLNLSFNYLTGSFLSQGFKGLSNLKNLQVLDLSKINTDNSSVLLSVSSVTSLKTLNLSGNLMRGSFPSRELGNLKNLEVLDVSHNDFDGVLPIQELHKLTHLKTLRLQQNYLSWNQRMQKFATFKNLEILDLSFNQFQDTIPQHSWAPLSLKALSLSGNYLNGSLTSFCGLKRLQQLDLSQNSFGGNLDTCLQNMTSLKLLDLSGNQFTGEVPRLLASLKSLEYIDLSFNLFEGSFSFNLFANHSSLEVFQFRNGNNKFVVHSEYPDWIPSFQLQVLVLQNCGLDKVPEFLVNQFSLKAIDLSDNEIKEKFPSWLFENNTGLVYLNLKNNSFSGPFHLPAFSSFNNIVSLDVSDNRLEGQVQDGGKMFPNIKFLDLSGNSFRGNFLFSPDKDCKLMGLDLSVNNFSGEVPEKLVSSCISLEVLKLSHNDFHGQIFTSRFNLTRLHYLQLNDNQFGGTLSSLNIKLDELDFLDLTNNHFHGDIPRWIGNLKYLDLFIPYNSFEGKISCELLSGDYIDLSYNFFSGSLPSCFNLTYSSYINLQGNRLNGSIPEYFLNSSSLLTLKLGNNNLFGSIPNSFGDFSSLTVLSLAGNSLNGSIPTWLCRLNQLNQLDLSRNNFVGSIPNCLCNLSFGSKEHHGAFGIGQGAGSYTIAEIYNGSLVGTRKISSSFVLEFSVEQKAEFVTKHRGNTYKGEMLKYMSGLDLSGNNLTGEIPREIGNLSQIRALNLSHNQLTGSIPKSFFNFSQIESLDLSYNTLSGKIPTELIDLNFLSVFTVAYNNLSGRVPDMKKQFSTFDNSSYEGNPFLCGPPLIKDCNADNEEPDPLSHDEAYGKWYEIDQVVFFASFSVSFAMFFLGIITLLYVNPYWRQRLFYYFEEFMISCYYYLYDNMLKYVVRLYH